jgi:hypothetical protein
MKQVLLVNASQNDDQEVPDISKDDHAREQKQLMAKNITQFEVSMLENREERIQQIETDVLDINAIMRELAWMAKEQGEQIGECTTQNCNLEYVKGCGFI